MAALPDTATDATGADSYASLISAPSGNLEYSHLRAACETNGAILSFDGGTTDHACLVPGQSLALDGLRISGAIHAKNLVSGSNYANLVVTVW